MKELILSLFIWLGLISPPTSINVTGYDPGGEVGTYILFWDRIAASGLNVVIDGACVSACTMVTAEVPPERVCVTPRAQFGLHQASYDGKPDPEVTLLLQVTFYPAWLQSWIRDWEAKNGPLTEEVVYVGYETLRLHYRTCYTWEAPNAGSQEAI